MWHIFYKDLYNDNPLWQLYDDFVDTPIFHTKKEVLGFLDQNKEEFEGCRVKVLREKEDEVEVHKE